MHISLQKKIPTFKVFFLAITLIQYFYDMFAVERVADTAAEVPPEEVALPSAAEERIMELVLEKMPSTTNSISSVTK